MGYDKTLNFLGKHVDEETAKQIAEGKVDARSLKPRNLCVIAAPTTNIEQNDNQENKKKNVCVFKKRANRETNIKKRVQPRKNEKYFGKLNDVNIETGDGLTGDLDEMFSQFLCPTHTETADANSTQSTECCEEKEIDDDAIDIAANSDNELEQENINKPLKRHRKRKRSAIDFENDATPFKEMKNSHNRMSRRKLNDGSVEMNHLKNTTTPKNSFFTEMTPRNRRKSQLKESSLNVSIISDLMSNSKKKRRRSLDQSDEQKENQIKCITNNPFSVNRKKENVDNDFYEINDDDDDDDKNMKYSQNSQSQNE